MTAPATVDRLETAELRPALPSNLPVKLQALLYVHLRVTSRRWKIRRAAQDGTVFHLPDGPVMRVRTELLEPVPPLERIPT